MATTTTALVDAIIRREKLQGRHHLISLWAVSEWRQQLIGCLTPEDVLELDQVLKALRAANPEFNKSITAATDQRLHFKDGLKEESEGSSK